VLVTGAPPGKPGQWPSASIGFVALEASQLAAPWGEKLRKQIARWARPAILGANRPLDPHRIAAVDHLLKHNNQYHAGR
jgi:hypothetical protein